MRIYQVIRADSFFLFNGGFLGSQVLDSLLHLLSSPNSVCVFRWFP